MSYLFPDFSLAFFREISEQASRQLVTKEQRKFCKHAKRRNWRYYNMSKNETPQRENEMNTPTSEGFTLSQIASLRTEIKKNTANTRVIVSCSKTKQKKIGMMKSIARLA